MKPSITVKTKDHKHYLQIRTAFGDLIHIGSTSKAENWRVAHAALIREYNSLADYEIAALLPYIQREKIDPEIALSSNIESCPETWNAYNKKLESTIQNRIKNRELYEICPNPKYLYPWEQIKWRKAKKKGTSVSHEFLG